MDCGRASENRQKASYEQVCVKWVYDVWKLVVDVDDFIIKGFEQCGYINFDADYNKLHSHLRDTIVHREVPIDIILKVDEALLELQKEIEEG